MSQLSASFVELVRRAAAGKVSTLRVYCLTCRDEKTHVLVGESDTTETYACAGCGNQKCYTVR